MSTLSSWEAQTREMLDRVLKEVEEIQTDTEQRISVLQQRKWALEESLIAYQEMVGSELTQKLKPLTKKDVQNRSLKNILYLIGSRNNDLLIVKHAIRLMKEADVFGNPDNADSVVYSILSRSRDFVKLGKGVYKLNGSKELTYTGNHRTVSGVKQAVKELKEEHPLMNKSGVQRTLVKRGFDFKGKRPGNAVNMAWVALGYSKKEVQQILIK